MLYAVATFGENLRTVREARGLTQERLATLLGHKRPSVVQSWEKNRRRPRPATITKVAKHLACTPSMLLKGVPADYDQLRGADTDADGITGPLKLTPSERRMLELLRQMSEKGQHRAVDYVEAIVPSFPPEVDRTRTPQPADTTPAKARTARGTRKAARG